MSEPIRGRVLPDDVCRCHDSQCEIREQCLRYLHRSQGGERVVSTASMRIPGQECTDRINPGDSWLSWRSGECPIASDSVVEVAFNSGGLQTERSAGSYCWRHENEGSDIVAFRVSDGTQ